MRNCCHWLLRSLYTFAAAARSVSTAACSVHRLPSLGCVRRLQHVVRHAFTIPPPEKRVRNAHAPPKNILRWLRLILVSVSARSIAHSREDKVRRVVHLLYVESLQPCVVVALLAVRCDHKAVFAYEAGNYSHGSPPFGRIRTKQK